MAARRILSHLARTGSARLLDKTIKRLLPGARPKLPDDPAEPPTATKTLLGALAGTMLLRLAARSVPGAIVVGGAMLAKRRYDKRHSGSGKGKDAGKAAPKA